MEVIKLHSLTGHRDCVYSVEPGMGSVLFSAGADGMVVKWDMKAPETGELIANLPNSVYALHYLSEKDKLVAAQNFEGIHLLDYKNKKERSLKLSDSYIFDLKSWNNKLFVGKGDGEVAIIDIEEWRIIDQLKYSNKSARAIAINGVSGEFAVGYSDNTIRIFDLRNHELKYNWEAHSNSVFTVQYSPDHNNLLSGSRDAHLKIWDVRSEYDLLEDIAAHMYTINHIAFSPDSKHFVTCSMDKSIKVWCSEGFRLLKVIDKARYGGHGTSVNKLVWTSFNNQLVSASDDRTLSVWDIIF